MDIGRNDHHDHHEVRLGLGLGLGLNDYDLKKRVDTRNSKKPKKAFLGLSIPLHESDRAAADSSSNMKGDNDDDDECKLSMDSSCRKKLRLTRDQTTLLEDRFKLHTTLNTAQKQALAEKLNLKPRQVEVWFQNRRARTKLKKTEVDCEFLKKKCERLSEENWRLKTELLELRSTMKMENPPPAPGGLAPQFLYHNHNHKAAAAAAADACARKN